MSKKSKLVSKLQAEAAVAVESASLQFSSVIEQNSDEVVSPGPGIDQENCTESAKKRAADKIRKIDMDTQGEYSRLLDGYIKNGSSTDLGRDTIHDEEFNLILSGRSDVDLKDTFRNIALSATKDALSTSKGNVDDDDPNYNGEVETKNKSQRQRSSDIPWTEEEQQALMIGFERYGMGSNKWAKIKMDPELGDILQQRSNGDLKEKYRSLQLTLSRVGERPPKRSKTNDSLWSEEEKNALLQGFERYGMSSNKWRKIQMDPDFGEILRRRSNGDLKDKYRNIQLSVAKSGDRLARREKGETLWTEEEKQALILGYEKYGMCNNKWRKIQMDPEFGAVLARRSNGDLKDKYRNIQLSLSRSTLEPRKRDKGGDLPWTEEEKQALILGYERYSMTLNKWMRIKQDHELGEILQRRSERGLKVKFRNMQISASGGHVRRSKKDKNGQSSSSNLQHYGEGPDDDPTMDDDEKHRHMDLGILDADHPLHQSSVADDNVLNLSSMVIVQDPMGDQMQMDMGIKGQSVEEFPFQLSSQSYPAQSISDHLIALEGDDEGGSGIPVHDLVEKSALAAIAARKRKAEFAAESEANMALGLGLDYASESQGLFDESDEGVLKRVKIDQGERQQ
eukprot:gene28132-37030_t